MSCVIFNSAAAGPTRRGATAQEEKRSPARIAARNPIVRSFTVIIPGVARGNQLKTAELCRIIRHLGSAMHQSTLESMPNNKTVKEQMITIGVITAPEHYSSVNCTLWREGGI